VHSDPRPADARLLRQLAAMRTHATKTASEKEHVTSSGVDALTVVEEAVLGTPPSTLRAHQILPAWQKMLRLYTYHVSELVDALKGRRRNLRCPPELKVRSLTLSERVCWEGPVVPVWQRDEARFGLVRWYQVTVSAWSFWVTGCPLGRAEHSVSLLFSPRHDPKPQHCKPREARE
jgi:hypothetical protein